MKIFFLFVLLHFTCGTIVRAEYRVFVLKISKSVSQPGSDPAQPAQFRLVTSNLDPEQYKQYYPIGLDEKIEYIDTWRCFGRTGDFQDYCPKPEGKDSQKAQIPPEPVSN